MESADEVREIKDIQQRNVERAIFGKRAISCAKRVPQRLGSKSRRLVSVSQNKSYTTSTAHREANGHRR